MIHTGPSTAANIIAQYILARHESLRKGRERSSKERDVPLMISMQGPQGSGKSTIAKMLVDILGNHRLNCAVASLDDFYLTHDGLEKLAESNPTNPLLHGRGQPGTHDIDLLVDVLTKIRGCQPVSVPVFDKSKFSGEGDRAHYAIRLGSPIDVAILEGWSMGFQPLSSAELERLYAEASSRDKPPVFLNFSLDSLQTINANLSTFAFRIYPLFDAHVTLQAESHKCIYSWRLQQERAMKEHNGGNGMTDDQVRCFVDRYMPGYELFEVAMLDYWVGRGMLLRLGSEREVVAHASL